ncbi:MAG: ribosomal-protein-alanine N-acetyltransferase [Nitrospinota bacterium]|nr:MAG: ribosomal-protein-alanine N-acetyltransferase [Nitrospinota bacterium]
MGIEITPMQMEDIDEVLAIERASYLSPWSYEMFRAEIEQNRFAYPLVARKEGKVVGYICLWKAADEAHIANIAVHPDFRRQGIGSSLLEKGLEFAREMGCTKAVLEVRVSNLPARRLYTRFHFAPVGIRKGYYTDTNEDALVLMRAPL